MWDWKLFTFETLFPLLNKIFSMIGNIASLCHPFYVLTGTTLFKDDAPHTTKLRESRLKKAAGTVIKRRLTETTRRFTRAETHLNKLLHLSNSHLARWMLDFCFCYWIFGPSVSIHVDDLIMCPFPWRTRGRLPFLLTDNYLSKDYHFEKLYNILSS